MKRGILFIMGVYPSYGGVEKVSTVLANAFSEDGNHVVMVSFEQPYPELATEELTQGIKIYKLDYPVYSNGNIEKLRHILLENNIDIIINQWALPWSVTRLCRKASKRLPCKLISVYHNIPNTNKRIKDIEQAIANKQGSYVINKTKLAAIRFVSRLSIWHNIQSVDRMVVLSESFIPLIRQFAFSRESKKICCLTNPVTISATHNGIQKQNEIIYVGRIEYNQKRTYRLIDIWKELSDRFPNWRLTIVGDGPDSADLKQRINNLNVNNISIEGFQNPQAYYERAKLLLLVSEYEGFPLVLAEAMINHVVPIVLGSYSAAYDIVRDGAGIVCKMPFSAEVFVNELSTLMTDKNLLTMIAEKAGEVAEDYSLPVIKEKWYKLFDTV